MPDRNSDVDNIERLEAEARVICWQHSRIPHPDIYVAGYPRAQRAKERAALREDFDDVTDRWAVSKLLKSIERISEGTS
jgi:hypothetical protein